jgi:hypothetical protein
MNRQQLVRAAMVMAGLLAVGGCSSDDHDRSRSSRSYDDRSRPIGEYRSDPAPGYNARQARNTGGEYRPDPVPGYNAREARNERRDAERYNDR